MEQGKRHLACVGHGVEDPRRAARQPGGGRRSMGSISAGRRSSGGRQVGFAGPAVAALPTSAALAKRLAKRPQDWKDGDAELERQQEAEGVEKGFGFGAPPPPPPEPAAIRRLEEAVVNRIAAGEVIQRPASALKELVENSLDAGAAAVAVAVKDGGLKSILITDDGHGIREEDLPILCERHTTSKLREYEDLQRIATLGFRGEALASISFVAHVTVTTMTAGQSHALRATYKDGKMEGEARPCAGIQGTQILVENLFYNVAARRKAFRNPGEEYGRVLDVISRFAVHNSSVAFTCKKHGDSRADIQSAATGNRLETFRAVYGSAVAKELIPISIEEAEDGSELHMKAEGYLSSANYSAKRTIAIFFINNRLVECGPLKRACEAVYAAILPKAAKPFLYLSITLPPEEVDVNVHPTKREVTFLNQELLVERVQLAVEIKLLESNTSRTFYTQSLLPGAAAVTQSSAEADSPRTQGPTQASQKAPVNKLVRTDNLNPAGRRAVRQRRNPLVSADLTSIQELLAAIDQGAHGGENSLPIEFSTLSTGLASTSASRSRGVIVMTTQRRFAGLSDIVKQNTYVGMADDDFALIQHKTKLYLVNVVTLSKELFYQQVIRRFSHFNAIKLSSPAPLLELLLMALDDEEHLGNWQENDGPKEKIAELNKELLLCKAEMLREYFAIDIDEAGNLHTIPLVLDQHTPDLDHLPQFVLSLSNNVDWESEKECFDSVATVIAEFYCCHPPLLPSPNAKVEVALKNDVASQEQVDVARESTVHDEAAGCEGDVEGGSAYLAGAEVAWAQREWTIQHLLLPAMKFFLVPPTHLATDGTFVQIAALENLYKIFERC
eukprot:SM000217S06873  [mRNA]  locus=s217:172151:179282:- [translate_table: standard]